MAKHIYSPNGQDLGEMLPSILSPMTAAEASEYGPQWGICNKGSEPGAVYYGSYPAATHEEARARTLLTISSTLPRAKQMAKEGSNPDVTEEDVEALQRLALFDIQEAPELVPGYAILADRLSGSLIVERLSDGLTSERLTGQDFLDVLSMDSGEAEGLFIDGLEYS